MNLANAILWGFVGTVVLSTLMSGTRGLGWTRMDIPFILGALVTPDRDKARWIGFLIHFFNGWVFALIYIAAFHSTGIKTPWFGMAIGLVHSLFVLTAGMAALPGIHPRMASEHHGPDPTRQLEPPGFLALNYGRGTPISTIAAHLVFGCVLGWFY